MLKEQRRIVTGHDEEGRSVVLIDGPPAAFLGALAEVWNSAGGALDTRSSADRAAGEVILSPAPGGTKFRYFMVRPEDASMSPEAREQAVAARFEAMGAAHERVDTTRHPAMHKTKTLDYIVLLSGEVTLLLDGAERDLKPFDVVVQQGTNHAWVNKGSEPALLVGILIDAEIG